MTLRLTQINIYPVKSLGGITVSNAYAGERGFQYDRRWMIATEDNVFITQREVPAMALIGAELKENGIYLFEKRRAYKGITIPYSADNGLTQRARVWNDECDVVHYDAKADQWLSDFLNIKCRLLFMPDQSNRKVDTKYSGMDMQVSFADAFPYLVIGESSLSDLNDRLEEKLPMNRFRPNLVFSGGKPYQEDTWKEIHIGKVLFRGERPCGRCPITTVNQETSETGKEPLRTLATYRQVNNKILYGMYLIAVTNGIVKLGDEIHVTEKDL
jgi:uncharacterized protein